VEFEVLRVKSEVRRIKMKDDMIHRKAKLLTPDPLPLIPFLRLAPRPSPLFLLFVSFVVILSSCSSAPPPQAADAMAAANAATAALDNGGVYLPGTDPLEKRDGAVSAEGAPPTEEAPVPAASGAMSASGAAAVSQGGKPAWVDNIESSFPKSRYVAAVGYGADRRGAENNALANLVAIFGQSVQSEMKIVSTYSEAVKNGSIDMANNSELKEAVTRAAALDTLIGAEIPRVWLDEEALNGTRSYYAAAVMDKVKTPPLYAGLIHANEQVIEKLTSLSAAEKNTLDGYSRYLLAGAVADTDRLYANVLSYLGNMGGIDARTLKAGDEYRLAAREIAARIAVAVNVSGDSGGRIRDAIMAALSDAGLRTARGTEAPYAVDCTVSLSPVDLPSQKNKFVRYQISASLRDVKADATLFPYTASGREGHITFEEAEERAYRAAAKTIGDEFEAAMQDYLSAK
jgi:hypothetical protein